MKRTILLILLVSFSNSINLDSLNPTKLFKKESNFHKEWTRIVEDTNDDVESSRELLENITKQAEDARTKVEKLSKQETKAWSEAKEKAQEVREKAQEELNLKKRAERKSEEEKNEWEELKLIEIKEKSAREDLEKKIKAQENAIKRLHDDSKQKAIEKEKTWLDSTEGASGSREENSASKGSSDDSNAAKLILVRKSLNRLKRFFQKKYNIEKSNLGLADIYLIKFLKKLDLYFLALA